MITQGDIVRYENGELTIRPKGDVWREIIRKGIKTAEIRLDDGRTISIDQRRKAYALLQDIAKWSGDNPEYIKDMLKFDFCGHSGCKWFSLSDCDMTTAREYISYLIEFCIKWDVPCMDTLLNRTDDIGRYLYLCLEYRRCCISGKPAQIHHVDRIGMGRHRDDMIQVGMHAIALSPYWHDRVHREGEREIFDKYHVYGIALDEHLCRKWRLGRTKHAEYSSNTGAAYCRPRDETDTGRGTGGNGHAGL